MEIKHSQEILITYRMGGEGGGGVIASSIGPTERQFLMTGFCTLAWPY